MTENNSEIFFDKRQTSKKNQYISGPCYCGDCTAFDLPYECKSRDNVIDWHVGDTGCCFTCPDQKLCVPPDIDECYVGNSLSGKDPRLRIAWNGKAPDIRCYYDRSEINTVEQLRAIKDIFGKIDSDLGSKICMKPSDGNCVAPLNTCSIPRSTTSDGKFCVEWFQELDKKERDATMLNYCYSYNTEDCRCINRLLTDEYRYLKPGNPINDNCWFVPCSNGQVYMVPSELAESSCPQNVCEIIFNIYKNRDVKIYDNDFTCDMSGGGGDSFVRKYWPVMVTLIVGIGLVSMLD